MSAEIRTLYDGETQVIPRTKVVAVEDNEGTPLQTLLDKKLSKADLVEEAENSNVIATKEFVTNSINEAIEDTWEASY